MTTASKLSASKSLWVFPPRTTSRTSSRRGSETHERWQLPRAISGTTNMTGLQVRVSVVRQEFDQLCRKWKQETGGLSNPATISMNPEYQAIIGMGKDALPFILADLQDHDGHWFWALRAITRLWPISDAQLGDYQAMKDAWLDWGRRNGYLPDRVNALAS